MISLEKKEEDGFLYSGNCTKCIPNGKGIMYNGLGNKSLEGTFKGGALHGMGISYYDDGSKLYEGNFEFSKANGFGTEYRGGGKIKEGNFKDSVLHG